MARAHAYLDTAAVSKRLVIPQCPITSGRATKMTRASFNANCARYREGYSPRKNVVSHGECGPNRYCAVCRGENIPPEVKFVEIDELVSIRDKCSKKNTQPKERKMAYGTCGLCGAKGNVYPRGDEKICSTCKVLCNQVEKRIDVVAHAIKAIGKEGDILTALDVQVAATAAVEGELLDKLAALVGYEGESGDELFDALRKQCDRVILMDKSIQGYANFLADLRDILGNEVSQMQDLLDEVRVGVACGKAIDNVAEALCLPDEFTEDDVAKAVGELIAELSVRVDPGSENANKDELVAASTALSEICRALGIDDADERLQYKDVVVGSAQVAAQLEQAQRLLDEVAVITDASSFDHDDVLKAVRHSEALLEEIDRQLSTTTEPEIVRQAQQMAQQINVQADQLSEAEQKLLADEQVFARIREVIGADGAAPGDLPGAIETLITLSPAPRRNGNRHVDSHLLDLLTEFPQIGVDRIAVLREAV